MYNRNMDVLFNVSRDISKIKLNQGTIFDKIKYLNQFKIPIKYPMGLKYYFKFITDIAVFAVSRQKRRLMKRRQSDKARTNDTKT